MTVAAHIARGRRRHALVMVDACTVTRPGTRVYNEATQDYTTPTMTAYTGPCRVKVWRGLDEQAAEAEVNVMRYHVDLPLTGAVPDVVRRDTLTITASLNPALPGRAITVTEVQMDSTATALRVIGEVTT